MPELLAHLVGDYILQSHWMATEKTKKWWPAILHGLTYTLPFIVFTTDIWRLAIIGGTHVVIDRYRLAKWVARIKNWKFTDSGYPEDTPPWLWVWLMIVVDNTMHLLINHFVLSF